MVAKRKTAREIYTAGRSSRNQWIRRLWRDVFQCVTALLWYASYVLEQNDIFDWDNPVHLLQLHYIFLPRINFALNEFMGAYSIHRLLLECYWTPTQIWCNSINDPGNSISNDLVDEEVCDTEYYWEGSKGSYPIDPDLNNIVVPPVDFPLAEATNDLLCNSIDPVLEPPDMETSIYVASLELVHVILEGKLWSFAIKLPIDKDMNNVIPRDYYKWSNRNSPPEAFL